MAEQEETDYPLRETETTGVLDDDEFHHAFEVFSENGETMGTNNSVLIPFLKSLGIRTDPNSSLVSRIKDISDHGVIREVQLKRVLTSEIPVLKESWPSHRDVLRAFQVFDTEGVGFIKVTMLKRFLVQAQLDEDEAVLERLIKDNCQIDGDDLINYMDFVQSIKQRHEDCT